ncbi:MAG: ornithine carbamoyltransferase [Chitinivibrionales bacterium]|nr:ornithine carbamoyltransferase [Chitinivibrionales bacterium]MBD3397142.1 ornithine carbamoyltransferase [Chitinivibrionales bacterium]
MPNNKNLICLLDYSPEEIRSLIASANALKQGRLRDDPQAMAGRSAVLIFEKPSLRTRITFETAIHEVGGHAINLAAGMVQMGRRESVEDVAQNLQRWVHLIVVRTYSHDTVVKIAASCSIPVINALTDAFHPCQALAFAQTVDENLGGEKKVKVVFVGDGNNVCASLMIVCARLGWDFVLACPAGYEPPPALLQACADAARDSSGSIDVTHDPVSAVADASWIYTDVWASMGQEAQQERRAKDFAGFQVNDALIARAPTEVLVSHCLPAHRGEEITSEVLDSSRSRALDEAENRLHAQKAVIVHLFS